MPAKRKRPPGGGAADLRRRGMKAVLLAFTPEEVEELKRAAGTFTDGRRHVSVFAAGVALAAAREINGK
jgi:hypothetical protein